MLLIIVILLTAYIVVPLVDLTANEHVRYALKIVVYVLTLAYVLYALVTGKLLV
jgi:hypothetical protein